MDLPLDRVRSTIASGALADRRERERIGPAAELAIRGLVVGLGIGAILSAERPDGTLGVLFAGVVAIGAALVELGS
jgi:hypothetical protein